MESAENSTAEGAFVVKEDENVTLRVNPSETPAFYFTMKRGEPLLKLMTAYSESLKLGDYNGLTFIAGDVRVRSHQTPNELQLRNNNVIDAVLRQLYKKSAVVMDSDEEDFLYGFYNKRGVNRVKEEADEKVTLRVQQEGTADFYFTMKRKEPLRNLMMAYCERRKLGDYRSLRFHLNGDRITGNQTPNELELENDDVLDAWSDQFGGAPSYA